MKFRPIPCLLALCAATAFTSLPAQADLPDPATKDKVPPIAYVQGNIWRQLKLADFTLTGTVRSDKDKSKKVYPIILRTKQHEMVYEFQDQPLQIRVQLDPGVFTVQKRASSSAPWADVTPDELSSTILDTDITYEDLDIDFINWDDIQPLGTDNIKTLDAYVFEAKPGPTDHSRFSSVRFWVSKLYWALLRVDGINAKGQTIKRVEVQDVMQIGKYYVFKEMKVANMLPDKDDIAASTTYIDISDGKEGSGLTN
jgi:outer membrane lipoprotein-sorting protein